jgi:aryl-alcohol dehydrogenase-like predicted oxidoreductase
MTNTSMNYRLLGRSGLCVSDLCLGTMTFGEDWGWGAAKEEALKMYDTYREAGGNFIDTANIYTNGSSEKLIHARKRTEGWAAAIDDLESTWCRS